MTDRYQLFTTTDPHELWARIDTAAERFTTIVAESDPTSRLTSSSWTVRDVAGHLLTVVRRYKDGSTLGDTPRDVDRINDEELVALGDASAEVILSDLAADMEKVRERMAPERLDLHMKRPFHGGVHIDLAAILSNLLAEFFIHGRDVAQTVSRPWQLGERDCVLILNGVLQILPAYALRTSRESLAVRLTVPAARPWMLNFNRGTLVSRPAEDGERADAVLRVRAEPLVLLLYSRVSSVTAVRSGMFVIGGRRPWRVLRLPRMLERP